ncbi:MAG: redoxin domain-containing protein [Myxococcota bacterium]
MSAPKTESSPRRLDLLGRVAIAAYVAVGGFFVWGFGGSLSSAIETQNDTPCRSLAPRHARVQGTVLDAAGEPVAGAEIVPVTAGRTGTPIKTLPDGGFSLFLPKRSQSIIARAPGKLQADAELVIEPGEVIEVEFRLADEGGESTFKELSRASFEVPDFVAKDLQGNEVRLSDYRGKTVVLNFWATWCEPCITEWPQLHQLAQRLQGRDDVVVLAVSVEEDPEPIKPFLERMSLAESPVGVLWDPTSKVHVGLGSDKIPDTYLVDEQGRVSAVFVNVREWGSPDAYHCVESSIGR